MKLEDNQQCKQEERPQPKARPLLEPALQGGALRARAGELVLEDRLAPSPLQGGELQGGILVEGGNLRVDVFQAPINGTTRRDGASPVLQGSGFRPETLPLRDKIMSRENSLQK